MHNARRCLVATPGADDDRYRNDSQRERQNH
uniref:Uncharacterized protein n=1 Tax=Erwinia amylovora ATCC BAA-2158 TaxID=889211 RepID=E5B738_ERWAM|nr:hypothetical protein predicted by Glimmer/Critica [Erwinia amylovora ATCC BAA-2158]